MVIKATVIKVLFAEIYVNVVFVIICLYSAVSLTLVKEYRFIRIIYYYYYFRQHRRHSSHWVSLQNPSDRPSTVTFIMQQNPL